MAIQLFVDFIFAPNDLRFIGIPLYIDGVTGTFAEKTVRGLTYLKEYKGADQ